MKYYGAVFYSGSPGNIGDIHLSDFNIKSNSQADVKDAFKYWIDHEHSNGFSDVFCYDDKPSFQEAIMNIRKHGVIDERFILYRLKVGPRGGLVVEK